MHHLLHIQLGLRSSRLGFLISFIFSLLAISLQAQTISTVSGTGIPGSSGDGSAATSARLFLPLDVAVDGSGNLYIADQTNNRIRKVTAATGAISTVAGTGVPGFTGDGGAATSARLFSPVDIAIDGSGNFYIADQLNQRIRKVTVATGGISTVAGTGTLGFAGDGGAATSARLKLPTAVVLDGGGNLYIADSGNNRIRKVTTATGIISTIAGTGIPGFTGDGGAATSARLFLPSGLFMRGGNLYIADASNNRIRLVANAPLPVSLVSFTAQPQPNYTVNLQWTTSLETNNRGFTIERSKDLQTFETVGEITELAPGSQALKTYTLTDQTPFAGTSYYRLSQIDLNGQITRFPAISAVLKEERYGIYPNPVAAGSSFVLRLDEPQTAVLSLHDAQGKLLPLQKLGVQSGNLLLRTGSSLPAGVYIITVDERAQTRRHRLVIP